MPEDNRIFSSTDSYNLAIDEYGNFTVNHQNNTEETITLQRNIDIRHKFYDLLFNHLIMIKMINDENTRSKFEKVVNDLIFMVKIEELNQNNLILSDEEKDTFRAIYYYLNDLSIYLKKLFDLGGVYYFDLFDNLIISLMARIYYHLEYNKES
ncbi:MAG: hypothetical protein KatS3mg085_113 [Candidatus Dojkabacteria bacterium]|nr:MAG: hypothetical protein KatS3mg085_113 [Candidatus Dojkabacteria bacterium]